MSSTTFPPTPSSPARSPGALRDAVRRVEALDDAHHLRLQLGGLPPRAPRGIAHLHHHHLLRQLRVLAQEKLERLELELDAFEHVEIVDAQEHFAPCKRRAVPRAMLLRVGPHEALLQTVRVHARGADLHAHVPTVVVDRERSFVRLVRQAQEARRAAQKVPRVVKRVKADDVGVEKASEDQIAVGKRAEHLRGGERGVEEVSAPHGVVALAEERR